MGELEQSDEEHQAQEPASLPDKTTTSEVTIGSSAGQLLDQLIVKVPKIYRDSILKAGVRLLHGTADLGAAWLQTKASELRSQQAAREKTRAAITTTATREISKDPALRARAADYVFAEYVGKQANREEVLRLTVEQLDHTPPHSSQGGIASPDEDWLNGFARVAENASSERAQALFAKVLAGEIRKPGQYSLFTLDFLSKMSQRDADKIKQLAPFVIGNMLPRTPHTWELFPFAELTGLEALGILSSVSIAPVGSAVQVPLTDVEAHPGKVVEAIFCSRHVVILEAGKKTTVSVPASLITEMGQELISLYPCDVDMQMLEELASELAPDINIYIGKLAQDGFRIPAGESAQAYDIAFVPPAKTKTDPA